MIRTAVKQSALLIGQMGAMFGRNHAIKLLETHTDINIDEIIEKQNHLELVLSLCDGMKVSKDEFKYILETFTERFNKSLEEVLKN